MIINNTEYRPLIYKNKTTNYIVSEFGEVVNKNTGKCLSQCINTNGRKSVCLTINGICYTDTVHRLVYIAFYGNIPDNMTINHKNEDFNDNHYTNLELMTFSENTKEYLKNNGSPKKIFSDTVIEEICKDLSSGIYYRDVAMVYNININYIYSILIGRKRKFISEKYLPFPYSAHNKNYKREIPHKYIQSLIIQGFTTKEIFKILEIKPNSTNNRMICRERQSIGIKDPKYFSDKFIKKIDLLIEEGKSNNEIYSILNIEYSSRIGFLFTRRRKKLGLPDFNENGLSLEKQKEIMDDIKNGMTNNEILIKYNLERNIYTNNLLPRLRQKYKNAKK